MSDDDKLDPEDMAFVGWMARTLRVGRVRDLLAGNDTQCFSTEQYIEEWRKEILRRPSQFPAERILGLMTPELARQNLLAIPDVVREVRPDVWAAVEGREP